MLYHLTLEAAVAGFELAQPTFRDDAGAAKNGTGSGTLAVAGSLVRPDAYHTAVSILRQPCAFYRATTVAPMRADCSISTLASFYRSSSRGRSLVRPAIVFGVARGA